MHILAIVLSAAVGFILGVAFCSSASEDLTRLFTDLKSDAETVYTILLNAEKGSEAEVRVAVQKARSILKIHL